MCIQVWQLVLEIVGKHRAIQVSSLGRQKQEGVTPKVLKKYHGDKTDHIFYLDWVHLINNNINEMKQECQLLSYENMVVPL